MLGIDWRAARVVWTVFLFSLVIFVIYLVHETILLFVAAFLLAYLLSPLLEFVRRFIPPTVSRTASLAVVYVVLILAIGFLVSALAGRLTEEAVSLAQRLPGLVAKHQDINAIPLPAWLEPMRMKIADLIRSEFGGSTERALPMIQHALSRVLSYAGSAIFLVIVPILAFLFIKDGQWLRESLLSFAAPHQRVTVENVLRDIDLMLAHYIRALLILAASTASFYMVFFSIIGLPYAFLVSVLAAPLEFIPIFGPLTASIIILLIALFTGFQHSWWIVIFLLAYRLFQDYVLQPYLLSSGIELHPLLVLFGALAGEQLGGIWGMFLSVPVLAVLRIVFIELKRNHRVETA